MPNKSRPPAPLPYRPSSAGPPIYRHSSMRHLCMSQNYASDILAAKKRFTPPPSMSTINSSSYGNQSRQNNLDKVMICCVLDHNLIVFSVRRSQILNYFLFLSLIDFYSFPIGIHYRRVNSTETFCRNLFNLQRLE